MKYSRNSGIDHWARHNYLFLPETFIRNKIINACFHMYISVDLSELKFCQLTYAYEKHDIICTFITTCCLEFLGQQENEYGFSVLHILL